MPKDFADHSAISASYCWNTMLQYKRTSCVRFFSLVHLTAANAYRTISQLLRDTGIEVISLSFVPPVYFTPSVDLLAPSAEYFSIP